jgi:hypothetical protein
MMDTVSGRDGMLWGKSRAVATVGCRVEYELSESCADICLATPLWNGVGKWLEGAETALFHLVLSVRFKL